MSVTSLLDLPETPDQYTQTNFPATFNPALADLDNTPASPSASNDLATLGRVLFYEKNLSANLTVACASCHIQALGFSDSDRFSRGFSGGRTSRNSMGLANSRFYENEHFFWDERANTLSEQILIPIQNSVEMGLSLDEAVYRVSSRAYSDYLFTQAFGSVTVTSYRIASALAQFVRAMVSYQTPYDTGLASSGDVRTNFSNFNASQNAGKALFFSRRAQCADCHVNERQGNQVILQGDEARNNGLDPNLVNDDNGVGDISGNLNDNGKFKALSLRNISLTAPYMHDGRFSSLSQVIEHYNSGVQPHPNLDRRLRTQDNRVRRLNLSNTEKQNLEDFLETLTDVDLISDTRFSDPFKASGPMPGLTAIISLLLKD